MIKNVIKDSIIYGMASILSRGLAMLVLPFYTRILSPADYGALDMITAVGALANLVVALEISQGLARFWEETKSETSRRRLASTAWWFSVVMYLIFLIASLLLSKKINASLLGPAHFLIALQMGLFFITINGLFYLLQNQFRWELRSKDYAVVSFIYALLTLILGGSFAYGLNLGLHGVLLGQVLAVLLATSLAWWRLRNSFAFEFDLAMLKRMLRFSAPLVPSGFATFLSLYVNRVALNSLASLSEVGLFGVGSRVAGIASLLIMGVNAGLTPLIYKHFSEEDTPKNLARIFNGFVAIALLTCLTLSLFSRNLLFFLVSPSYYSAFDLVYILAPALILSQMYIFLPGISIKNKTHWQLAITTTTSLVSIALNWLLIPTLGVYGAALATLLSSVAFFLLWLIFSQKLYPIPFQWRPVILSTTIFLTCLTIGFFQKKYALSFTQEIALKLVLVLVLAASTIYSKLFELNSITQQAAISHWFKFKAQQKK